MIRNKISLEKGVVQKYITKLIIQRMNLVDNFELKFRHPEIHATSHDGEIAFLASIPHENHPEQTKDEGALIISRMDPLFFRKVFLQLFESNNFQKTTVAVFLTLDRSTVFNLKGDQLPDDWFLENRVDNRETNPEKIMMLIPAEWLAEAKAIENFKNRSERRLRREANQTANKTLEKPKLSARPPSLTTIKENFPGSFNKAVDIYSPLNERAGCPDEKFYEVGNDINFVNFNNPANQGNLSFQESFENN